MLCSESRLSGGGAERFSWMRPWVIVAVTKASSSEDRVNGSFEDEASASVVRVPLSLRNSKAHALTPQGAKTRTVEYATTLSKSSKRSWVLAYRSNS